MESIKYPRTWHLPYSEKSTSDDKKHTRDSHFIGKKIVMTEKMDGENTTIYNDHVHARSLNSIIDSEDRRWIDTLRKLKIEGNIPDSYRICGENLFYKHTCNYNNLTSLFYVFSIWDEDICLSWEDTIQWCNLLDLKSVPVIYEGVYNKDIIMDKFNKYCKVNDDVEGFTIRLYNEFKFEKFDISLNKYVSNNFVLPDAHWRYSKKTNNKLSNNKNPWQEI